MEGVIVNYRRSKTTQTCHEMIVKVASSESIDSAKQMVGKKIVFTTPAGNKINGAVVSAHGNSGALRVRFEKGMPGQAIGLKVAVE
jgi:large subunit ribosomal protein L35Ae